MVVPDHHLGSCTDCHVSGELSMKRIILLSLSLALWAQNPIDLRTRPFDTEVYIAAIDVQVNPTNMPSAMLWADPILMLYVRLDSFVDLRADIIRDQLKAQILDGTYQPVALRTRRGQSLTVHFKNLIGEETAPVRLVQGPVCKNCPAQKAYTFSYGPNA